MIAIRSNSKGVTLRYTSTIIIATDRDSPLNLGYIYLRNIIVS